MDAHCVSCLFFNASCADCRRAAAEAECLTTRQRAERPQRKYPLPVTEPGFVPVLDDQPPWQEVV